MINIISTSDVFSYGYILKICMSGRHVFMGYLNNEVQTQEAIDENGWLHSGDIGKIDEDGFLSITGRIKGRI